jgi:hypothetical protein
VIQFFVLQFVLFLYDFDTAVVRLGHTDCIGIIQTIFYARQINDRESKEG